MADKRLVSIANYNISSITLGEGSFSKVKIARHKVLQTNVAMKIIKKHAIKDEYVVKNLEREALIMLRMDHINVVGLFEVLKVDDLYCLAMEYFAGGDF